MLEHADLADAELIEKLERLLVAGADVLGAMGIA